MKNEDYEEDTYQLYTEKPTEINTIYVIFSKTPLNKPVLKERLNEKLSEEFKAEGYTIPKAIESDKFASWLIRNRYITTDIQVQKIMITITK